MATYNLSGSDTFTLNNRVLNDLANNDAAMVTFPNDLTKTDTGKGGNTMFAKDEKGRNAAVVLRVMRASDDDMFLLGLLTAAQRDFAAQTLLTGSFVKRMGNGAGGVRRDVYNLMGGVFVKTIEGRDNVGGDTEQNVAVYNLMFADAKRALA